MQKMAASMGGAGMPPGAAEQMKNMTADDMKRAAAEMSNMDADTLKNQYSAAMNQQKASQDYALRGAEQLKKDGNKLVGEGKYAEAIEKYMRVKNNLKDDASPNARALRTSCMLNMSLCFNKTDRFNSAVSECTEVLRGDGRSLKAYYRRGQAYLHKKAFREAVADSRRAVKLAPEDETVAAELERAVADLTASGEADDGETPEFEVSAGASSATNAMGFGPDAMAKAAEAMKDPDFMSKASDMMENMTDEQMEAMTASMPGGAGMPKIDPKMAKQAASMMKNMKPEAMEGMMKMAAEMKDMGLDPASGGAPSADAMSKMAEKMKDPAMQAAMSDMMKNISPEQLKEMSKASGMNMSDEQAEQTAKMMQNIDPKTMQRLMAVGTAAQSTIAFVRKNKLLVAAVAVGTVGVTVSWLMRRWGWFGGGAKEEFDPVAAMGAAASNGAGEDPWEEDQSF